MPIYCVALQVPKKWREELRERQISTGRSKLHHSVTAADGTRKFLLQLHDGLIVEAVGIPADDADKSRLTACVSSQVTLNSVAPLHLRICASVHLCICASVHVLLDGWLAPNWIYGQNQICLEAQTDIECCCALQQQLSESACTPKAVAVSSS